MILSTSYKPLFKMSFFVNVVIVAGNEFYSLDFQQCTFKCDSGFFWLFFFFLTKANHLLFPYFYLKFLIYVIPILHCHYIFCVGKKNHIVD